MWVSGNHIISNRRATILVFLFCLRQKHLSGEPTTGVAIKHFYRGEKWYEKPKATTPDYNHTPLFRREKTMGCLMTCFPHSSDGASGSTLQQLLLSVETNGHSREHSTKSNNIDTTLNRVYPCVSPTSDISLCNSVFPGHRDKQIAELDLFGFH